MSYKKIIFIFIFNILLISTTNAFNLCKVDEAKCNIDMKSQNFNISVNVKNKLDNLIKTRLYKNKK